MGLSLIPLSIAFYLSLSPITTYIILLVCFMLVQLIANILSIFTISAIKSKTPPEQLGRIMSFTVTFSMSAQPIGQLIYGGMFDVFDNRIYIILLLTSAAVIVMGLQESPHILP